MFKTWLTETLGVKYPIIQGAMLWLAKAELASAASNAGALGMITSTSFQSGEEMRQELRKMKSLTDRPFGVNITLLPTRRPINHEEFIVTAIEEGVRIFETSGRSPEPYMELFRQAKARVLHKVARVRDAIAAERLGVDAVTIFGFEGGGHTGPDEVASLVLVPKAVRSLKIPVIAAGGFVDGRGLVAALALGAQGVTMGTRFLLSKECPMHPRIKEMLLKTEEMDTTIALRSINNGARVLKNEVSSKILELEGKGATLDDLYPLVTGARSQKAYASGDTQDAMFYCGQAVGLIDSIPTVREIIDGIINEAGTAARRLKAIGLPL